MQAANQHFSATPVPQQYRPMSFLHPDYTRHMAKHLQGQSARVVPIPPQPSCGRSDRVRETHPRTNQTQGAGGVQKPTVAVTAEFPMAHNFPVHAVHDGKTNEECFSDPENILQTNTSVQTSRPTHVRPSPTSRPGALPALDTVTDQGGHLILHNQERTEDTYSQKDESHEEPAQCGESICVTHDPTKPPVCRGGIYLYLIA